MVSIVIVAIFLHRHFVSQNEFETAKEFLQQNIPTNVLGEDSHLITFSQEDVDVSTGWKFLSGIYPTVTFRCRIDPSVSSRMVVLCYRPMDSDQWLTVETRVRRDHTAKITLRDLHRNTPYECFFACKWEGKTVKSAKVLFLN